MKPGTKIFPLEATLLLDFNFIICVININMATVKICNDLNTPTGVLVYYPGILCGKKYLKNAPYSKGQFLCRI